MGKSVSNWLSASMAHFGMGHDERGAGKREDAARDSVPDDAAGNSGKGFPGLKSVRENLYRRLRGFRTENRLRQMQQADVASRRSESASQRVDPVLTRTLKPLDSSGHVPVSESRASVLAYAAWHSLGWLLAANLIGVWLAVLLLFPSAGHWLGAWSYGRWTPVHLNFQLYGWMALPLVAWAMRIYRADRGPIATWSRAALVLWSLALTIGAVSWLNGDTIGKLFLDWSGYPRIFFALAILFLWFVLAGAYARAWRERQNRSLRVRMAKLGGLAVLLLVPFVLYIASDPGIYPAVNPDTGGPTGASQLESTLIIVLILLL